MSKVDNLKQYINEIYNERYSLFGNNCIHKSVKIFRKAKELGIDAKLVVCLAKPPKPWLGFPKPYLFVIIHFYTVVNGQKVDVTLSPEQEQKYCRNSDLAIYWPRIIKRT